uniref:Uncharacterized protein n=1 Tax=Plectus sambesii TaxID=2011161 RepID=A0A914VY86_9BILA
MKVVNQWADVTTCHGIKDVIKSPSFWGKICWSLLVFVFLIIMTLQLADTYRTYTMHHWVTTVYEENSGGINEFPTVTVCNYNRLRQSAATQYNLSQDNLIFMFHKMPPQKTMSGDFHMNDSSRESFIKWKLEHNMTIKKIFSELSPRCDDTFEYIGHKTFSTHNCAQSKYLNITPVFTAEFGQCYQLNIRLPYKLNYPGKKFALNLLLNAQLKEYLNFSLGNYLEQGFALQFHFGPKIVEWQWISVAPGFHLMIGLRERQNRVKKSSQQSFGNIWDMFSSRPLLSEPPCAKNPKLKYMGQEHYSREQCLVECIVQPVVENCGCISYLDSPTVPICEIEEYVACLELLRHLNISFDREECHKSCEEPCFDRRIEASMSFTAFPAVNQLQSLQKLLRVGKPPMTREEIWEDYASVDIFFEKLSVMVVEQYESFGLEALISSYGGQMSLWAGASLLTVVQAAVYIVYGIIACALGLIKDKVIAMGDGKVRLGHDKAEEAKAEKTLRKNCISVVDTMHPKVSRSSRLRSSSDA